MPPSDQHSERIPGNLGEDVVKKLLHTHEIVDRPEKFAEMFCTVAESQNAVRQKLIEILRTSIQHDVESRKEIKKVLKEIYDEDWKHFIRSIWGKVAAILWTILTLGLGYLFKKYLG